MATPFIFNTPIGASGYSGASGYTGAYPLISASVVDTPVASAVTINWAASNTHYITLSSSLTAVNFANATDGQLINLFITNPSSYTVSWPLTSILWSGGTATTQSSAVSGANTTDKYQIQYIQNYYYVTPYRKYYIPTPAVGFSATGGTLTSGNSYNQWTFTSSGTLVVTVGGTVNYAIIGGGGSGGTHVGGGGGAGGVLSGTTTLSPGSYSITVGNGGISVQGTSGSPYVVGNAGSSSSALGLTAYGGGGGGVFNYATPTAGSPFGSGGGAGGYNSGGNMSPTSGTSGQGYAGGNTNAIGSGGGGGGASQAGGNAPNGNGGNGVQISLPVAGTNYYYAGGGGGGCEFSADTGGLGGGGAGFYANNYTLKGSGSNATFYGSGGGGAVDDTGTYTSGSGYQGIVIIWSHQ